MSTTTKYATYERNPAKANTFPQDARRCFSCKKVSPKNGGYLTITRVDRRGSGRGQIKISDWRCLKCIDINAIIQSSGKHK